MVYKVIWYLFMIAVLIFLPERFWQCLYQTLLVMKEKMMSWKRAFTPRSLSFEARELMSYLTSLETSIALGKHKKKDAGSFEIEFKRFKEYRELIDSLYEKHRLLGVPLKELFREIKLNLEKEIQFEMKCASIAHNSYFQFLVMTLSTWGFILFTNAMIDISLKIEHYLFIIFLQLTGFGLFIYSSSKLKIKIFLNFDQLIKKLYLFLVFYEVNLSQTKAIKQSGVLEHEAQLPKQFLPCIERLEEALTNWKDYGLCPKSECQSLCLELWNMKDQAFTKFTKSFESIKFLILALFYLPAYFYYLYALFQFFMEQ